MASDPLPDRILLLPNIAASQCAEPRNMAYMTRLALWGEGNPAFKDFSAFLEAVQVRTSNKKGCPCART